MTRKRHLTARIKPATRDALKDQLAAIADGIIREREAALQVCALAAELVKAGNAYIDSVNRPWYVRLMWWRK